MLLALLAAPTAQAKGPLEAVLEGPGLDTPARFAWTYTGSADDPRRAPIEHLALATGLFTAVFADASVETFDAASSALRLRPPRGDLGPRYTLTYRLEGPGRDQEIVQDVYPYADPRPVTYLAPGQVVNGGGSWFVADESLREALVADGLPSDPPGDGAGHPWPFAVALAACLAAALATRRGTGTRRTSAV